jgi:hypothetical protein
MKRRIVDREAELPPGWHRRGAWDQALSPGWLRAEQPPLPEGWRLERRWEQELPPSW